MVLHHSSATTMHMTSVNPMIMSRTNVSVLIMCFMCVLICLVMYEIDVASDHRADCHSEQEEKQHGHSNNQAECYLHLVHQATPSPVK